MSQAPSTADILRLGAQTAAIKAGMPKKRWTQFVKLAHARGHTVGGELSDTPDALKERTASSLRAEAQKTVATAYAPAAKELSTREKAIGFLDDKRKADDASYRTWLTGEVGKLNAQARAADATITTQQSDIATETQTAIAAARADSLKRMAATNPTTDPSQSAALDTSAADALATQHVANARDQSAAISKIGDDSRTLATASVLSQQAARESSRQGDTLKALADLNSDKLKLASDQATATLGKTDDLLSRNATIQQSNREADLAAGSLGLKKDELSQTIAAANQKYKIESAKVTLTKWKAEHADTVAQAKVKLGYDQIASREGVAAAKRKLDKELTKLRIAEANKTKPKESKGVTTQERTLYGQVQKAQALFARWDANNAVPVAEREQKLRESGAPEGVIQLAHALALNHGFMTDAMRVQARKLGITHSAYFWSVPEGADATPPGGNPGR